MAKILIDKSETADSVVQKIKDLEDNEVVLVVPRDSLLTESPAGIKAIKKEAAAAKKKLFIESVDTDILALAKKNGIPSTHPLFRGGREAKTFSDIVVGTSSEVRVSKGAKRGKKTEPHHIEIEIEDEAEPVEVPKAAVGQSWVHEPQPAPGLKVNPLELGKESTKSGASVFPLSGSAPARSRFVSFFLRKKIIIPVILVVLLLTGYVWAKAFGSVRIVIDFKKVPWQYEHALLVSKGIAETDLEQYKIPGELFFDSKNVTQSFPASLREQVSIKAKGTISIYNAYGTAPQALVATTRFVTPGGKVFRIDRAVVVPGATKEGNTLRPAHIDVPVTADLPGPLYNVSSSKLTVPGFSGTPKYDGFYGVIAEPLAGGFSGERGVASDKDIAAGKAKVAELLKNVFKSGVFERIPQGFVIADGASEITVGKIEASKIGDEKGNFTVSGEASVRALGFRESDVAAVLLAAAGKENSGKKFRELRATYEKVVPNFGKGELSATVKASGILEPAFDIDGFREKIFGKRVTDIQKLLAGEAGFKDAKIFFRPFWLISAPFDISRIVVEVP